MRVCSINTISFCRKTNNIPDKNKSEYLNKEEAMNCVLDVFGPIDRTMKRLQKRISELKNSGANSKKEHEELQGLQLVYDMMADNKKNLEPVLNQISNAPNEQKFKFI